VKRKIAVLTLVLVGAARALVLAEWLPPDTDELPQETEELVPQITSSGVSPSDQFHPITVDLDVPLAYRLYGWNAVVGWQGDWLALGDVWFGDLWAEDEVINSSVPYNDGLELMQVGDVPARRGSRRMAHVVLSTSDPGTQVLEFHVVIGEEPPHYEERWLCVDQCVADINNDGQRDIRDAWLIAEFHLGCTPFDPCWLPCAEFGGDGVIDEGDVRYAASLAYLPCPLLPRVFLPSVRTR